MQRRSFLKRAGLAAAGLAAWPNPLLAAEATNEPSGQASAMLDPALVKDWLARWEKNILGDARNRYCDRELGEEIGWLVSPFLNGFYYGYQATHDAKWVERLADWADAWITRSVKEPDGFVGWPKSGTGGMLANGFLTDSLLGEAMGLRPIVLMAAEILKTPTLDRKSVV